MAGALWSHGSALPVSAKVSTCLQVFIQHHLSGQRKRPPTAGGQSWEARASQQPAQLAEGRQGEVRTAQEAALRTGRKACRPLGTMGRASSSVLAHGACEGQQRDTTKPTAAAGGLPWGPQGVFSRVRDLGDRECAGLGQQPGHSLPSAVSWLHSPQGLGSAGTAPGTQGRWVQAGLCLGLVISTVHSTESLSPGGECGHSVLLPPPGASRCRWPGSSLGQRGRLWNGQAGPECPPHALAVPA